MTVRLKTDTLTMRTEAGTLARIDRVLKGGELRAAFVRAAIEAELKRREKIAAERFPDRFIDVRE